ncbi:MAG TPA: hypothetical protein VNU24_01130 [Solirubrobacteraceae bacterium]|nr:hypothetical protein [Solirubrobacteraceae bacterium]
MALLCLIAASAYGASKVFSDKPSNLLMPNRGPLVPVAQGASDHDAWSLRLYARGGELCRVLSVAEGEVSQCAGAPASDGVEATSELSPWNRYLFGIAGAGVRDVRVRLGARSRTVPTRSLSSAQVRTGGLPAHVRFWVEVLPRTGGEEPTAQVQATGLAGKALGAPVPSCSETGVPGRC